MDRRLRPRDGAQAGAILRLAAMPATIAASPPPSHMVKPSRWRNSQRRIMRCVARKDGAVDRLAPGEARLDLVPVGDPLLAQPPAEEDRPVLAQRVEVHQPGLEPLEHAAHRLQLLEIAVDLLRVGGDVVARGHQLLGLAPVGPGAAGQDLEPAHRGAPGGILRRQVVHDPAHQRQRALGFLRG